MLINIKQIEHIANLARLEITAEEKEKFAQQLSFVLEYFEKLKELNIKNIEPAGQSTQLNNIYRADEVKDCPEGVRKSILNNAPVKSGDYFQVNKIL
ncbi:MAG: Asp-tRNA(Asn)/Glu-tRNA(Gln) amidotransferase subunit GatC [Candidatus Kuenenbacteria bacterium]